LKREISETKLEYKFAMYNSLQHSIVELTRYVMNSAFQDLL